MLQVVNGSNLIMVNLNSAVGNHITQKFARAYAKRKFSGIKAQFVFPQYLKNIPDVTYMLELYFTLYHHIIYVHLNIFSQLRLKHPDHHPLVSRPCIL